MPPITTEATADLTFGLMLAVARRMMEGDRLVRAGKFPGGQSRICWARRVRQDHRPDRRRRADRQGGGAPRARLFGMRVLYWTPRRKPEARSAKPD